MTFKYLQHRFSTGILQQTGSIALCQWSSHTTANQTVLGRNIVTVTRFFAAALVTKIRYMKTWKWLQHPKVKWGLRETGLWSSAECSVFCIRALLSQNTALSLSQQGAGRIQVLGVQRHLLAVNRSNLTPSPPGSIGSNEQSTQTADNYNLHLAQINTQWVHCECIGRVCFTLSKPLKDITAYSYGHATCMTWHIFLPLCLSLYLICSEIEPVLLRCASPASRSQVT